MQTKITDRDGVFITLVANIAEEVHGNGPQPFSTIGNRSMCVNGVFVPVSELRRTYNISMGELATYLQVYHLASVLGDLGTTTFVPYNPLFPIWVVKVKVKRVGPPIQPTVAELEDQEPEREDQESSSEDQEPNREEKLRFLATSEAGASIASNGGKMLLSTLGNVSGIKCLATELKQLNPKFKLKSLFADNRDYRLLGKGPHAAVALA